MSRRCKPSDLGRFDSNLPETSEFGAQFAALCDGPPTFRNLDILREDPM
jgi:hypothetical protein